MNKLVSGIQTTAFWFATIVAIIFILAIDLLNWTDPCLVIYGIDALIAFICASMFADWWRVKGSATSIYKWLTVLLFTLTFNDAIQFYARFLFEYDNTKYEQLLNSWVWGYRSMPKMVALIYLFSFALWQRFGSQSTYHDGVRQDMANGFRVMEARIIAGEVRFEGHSHDGLVLGAKLIIKPLNGEPEATV